MNRLLCFLSFVLLGIVTSSPILPERKLTEMSPDAACLFVCNVCFDGHFDDMMVCANRVCTPGMNGLEFIWLGRHCKDYTMVEKYIHM